MEHAQRRSGALVHRRQFGHDLFDEGVSRGQSRVDQMVGVSLCGAVDRLVGGVAQQVFRRRCRLAGCELFIAALHRLDRCAGMAGHLDFRDHLDMPGCGKFQDLDIVSLGVKTAAFAIS